MKNSVNQKRTIFRLVIFLFFAGVVIYSVINDYAKTNRTNSEKQLAKSVTIQFSNGASVTLTGYKILDGGDLFQKNDYAYVELDEKYLPSAVRPCSDVFSENGQMFAMTVGCGSYPAILIKGKIIAVKF